MLIFYLFYPLVKYNKSGLYLCEVKHILFKILFLVAGLFSTAAIVKFNKIECKENFGKDQCIKVCGTKITGSHTIYKITLPLPALLTSFDYPLTFYRNSNNVFYNFSNQFIRPDKTSHQHRALLI